MSNSTSSATPVPPAPSSKALSKSSKPSKRILLRLPPHILASFPSDQPLRKASRSKPATVAPPEPVPSEPQSGAAEVKAEQEAVSVPETEPELEQLIDPGAREGTPNPLKRKGVPGPKPGTIKRSAVALDVNGVPKPRGKPGPKKRIRVDGDNNTPAAGIAPAPHHKLGPKANQGAINAGLRALDRTGKPTRKWLRKGFQLKSFTGVTWQTPSWRAPNGKKFGFDGDGKSDTTGSSEDAKPGNASSMPSEKSNSGGDTGAPGTATDLASFPVPSPAAETLQPS